MPDVVLSSAEQAALSSLLAAEPVPGSPVPQPHVLALLDRLIPCDAIEGRCRPSDREPVECVELIERRGHGTHTLHIAFRNGEDVVELWLNRTRRPFAARDIAVLTMLAPLLRRLVRERPTAGLPDCLTTQERRVLGLVASGLTNAEIAERLSVAPCTVRKHLEHTYRKLGVSGRMGAIAALQGRDDPGLDLVARLERFA